MEVKEKLNLIRILRRRFYFLPAFVILLSSCYPLTVTTGKWRIRWDRDMKMGKYEVSAYAVDHFSTPHIDQIGLEGVILEDAYVTAPTCAPSRVGILTGRVQNRYGFETQIMEFYPTNMVEYLSGKYFVETGSFVMAAKPKFPSEYQVQKRGLPPTEINLAEALKTLNYTNGLVGKW